MLLNQFTDLDIPVSFMRYWIIGSPEASIKARNINYDENRVLQSFNQVGWQVDYLSHDLVTAKNGNKFYLPTKMKIVKDDLNATILLKNWKL